jgi:hypothetical protein
MDGQHEAIQGDSVAGLSEASPASLPMRKDPPSTRIIFMETPIFFFGGNPKPA